MLEKDTNKAREGERGKNTCLGVQGVTKVSVPLVTSHMLSRAAGLSIFFLKSGSGSNKKNVGMDFLHREGQTG